MSALAIADSSAATLPPIRILGPLRGEVAFLRAGDSFFRRTARTARRPRLGGQDLSMKFLGVVLLVVGLVALVYGGFQYTTHKKEVDMGPVQISKTEHHDVPLPPLLGIGCIVVGGIVLIAGGKGAR
jgi:uncharacterized membrane protein YidH (DUF202 family)